MIKFEIFFQPSTVPIEGSAINKDDLNELFETEKEKIAPILYLNPTDEGDLDDYRKLYAELLAKWQLFVKSAQITKTLKEKLPSQYLDIKLGETPNIFIFTAK